MVDITTAACKKFGFKHREQIQVNICGSWDSAEVMGVAHAWPWDKSDPGPKVLWVALGRYNWRVTHFNRRDMRKD
jgi:hypothetical protein